MPAAYALTADWATSNLDAFFYNEALTPGSRALAPSFLGGVTFNETTQQFNPSSVQGPARAGAALVAFNTAPQIPTGLAANRYHINSVTFARNLDVRL